ncbi:MAG: precorrin-6A synthase (deacetylating) [Candidatus Nanopelagicales bacterium]
MTGGVSGRRIHVIGIGAGSPEFITQQAVAAMNEVDVFLVADKGDTTSDMVALRRSICERFIAHDHAYRFLTVTDPERGPDAGRDGRQYTDAVADWHARRTDIYAKTIAALREDAVIGFLVWGDPAFYDSTIRIVDAVAERLPVEVRVTPGISAFQALAAAHGIVLHAIGEPVHMTTGRRLLDDWAPGCGTFVVMLDGQLACRSLIGRAPGLWIHWGAYLGLPQQELRSGRLVDVIDEIVSLRAELRSKYGWIMDVYALTGT